MVGGEVGAGGGAKVEGVVTPERVLFVGGPKHGQVLELYDEPQHVVGLEAVPGTVVEQWPEALHTQVTYRRTTMVLDVDDRRWARPVFIDTRVWPGGQDMTDEALTAARDAVVRQWMTGGRDVTPLI